MIAARDRGGEGEANLSSPHSIGFSRLSFSLSFSLPLSNYGPPMFRTPVSSPLSRLAPCLPRGPSPPSPLKKRCERSPLARASMTLMRMASSLGGKGAPPTDRPTDQGGVRKGLPSSSSFLLFPKDEEGRCSQFPFLTTTSTMRKEILRRTWRRGSKR